MEQKRINVIGAGLAGCECAYILAKHDVLVTLYEMKPHHRSEAHKSNGLAELVCSNSLKSEAKTNACGLLKLEMEILGSLFMEAAHQSRVPAGQALAVDRDEFSRYITQKIKEEPNITIVEEQVESVTEMEGITVIATGPLTSEKFLHEIKHMVGDEGLYFYDAVAPIVEADSIDQNIAYVLDRYGEKEGEGDYLNLPMNAAEYEAFYQELIHARQAERHEFDKLVLFEGCMPIEEMAKRGEKTLLFGPLKPVGLDHPKTGEKMQAVVQLRAENAEKTMYNLVGFQTSLAFSEQERVFKMIPGLANANFIRYGVMHKNSYINASMLLDQNFCLKHNKKIYFAGQISGVEGYVESAASGMMVAYSIIQRLKGKEVLFKDTTMMGSLSNYIATENKHFQPMNANFGIIHPLSEKIRDKKEKYTKLADIALEEIKILKESLEK